MNHSQLNHLETFLFLGMRIFPFIQLIMLSVMIYLSVTHIFYSILTMSVFVSGPSEKRIQPLFWFQAPQRQGYNFFFGLRPLRDKVKTIVSSGPLWFWVPQGRKKAALVSGPPLLLQTRIKYIFWFCPLETRIKPML